MADQVEGMIRDSDIKFECRLLIGMVLALPEDLQLMLLEPLHRIVKLENERLNKLATPITKMEI